MSVGVVCRLLAVAVAAYLLGSFPTGVIVGRLWKGIDVRQHGSGHTGGLNTVRTIGWIPGVLTALTDMGKGMAAIGLARMIGPTEWAIPPAALAVVAGHNWSLCLGFAGGLGIASLAGIFLVLQPEVLPLAATLFFVSLLLLRHRPWAASVMVLCLAPLLLAIGSPTPTVVSGLLAGGASFVKHVVEIRRGYDSRPIRDVSG